MRSVFHIGIDLPSHSKEGIRKGFLQAGFTEYNFFNWQQVRLDCGILGCQTRMIRAAQELNPDLIFIQFQNSEICDEETAMELSKCGFTVNYSYDIRDAERTEWMYELSYYFGLTLFACKEDADEGKRRGLPNTSHIHSSCDPDQYRPSPVPEHLKSKYPEIVFIGNNYERTNLNFEKSKEREEMVNFMKAEFGDKFGVYGMNWGADSRIINPVEENIIYNSAKIVICHNNFLRTRYCSDRQWRALSCGAATIIHHYIGIEDDFNPSGSPMGLSGFPIWKTMDDIKYYVNWLLNNEKWRLEVGGGGRELFLSWHTWYQRISRIKFIIHELTRK